MTTEQIKMTLIEFLMEWAGETMFRREALAKQRGAEAPSSSGDKVRHDLGTVTSGVEGPK